MIFAVLLNLGGDFGGFAGFVGCDFGGFVGLGDVSLVVLLYFGRRVLWFCWIWGGDLDDFAGFGRTTLSRNQLSR